MFPSFYPITAFAVEGFISFRVMFVIRRKVYKTAKKKLSVSAGMTVLTVTLLELMFDCNLVLVPIKAEKI